MRVLVTGGTGFLGRHLVRRLTAEGHTCHLLVRREPASYPVQTGVTFIGYDQMALLPRMDAVINLAGEWVVGRWTEEKKRRIMESRVDVTRQVVDWMRGQALRPRVFLSASAVGIYGDRPGEVLDESSPLDPRRRFRYEVCQAWEDEARRAEALGVRTIYLRIGNVLDGREGFLGILLPWLRRAPFLIPFAPESINPWISLGDALRLFEFALSDTRVFGPLNVVGPKPKTLREFVRAIGHRIHRPVFGQIPSPVLSFLFGEFSRSLIESQDIRPARALTLGFRFEDESLDVFLGKVVR